MDKRKSLEDGTVLRLDKQYTIKEEIGRGASCLVYDGFYKDSLGLEHKVRIKECFPFHIEAVRDEQGAVVAAEMSGKEFEVSKKDFSSAYRKNVQIKKIIELDNSTIDAADIYCRNNTLYSVMNCIEGDNYSKFQEKNLQSIFMRLKKLCLIIQNYHEHNFLHLDVKPENILIPYNTNEQIVLFDFDSLHEIHELRKEKELRLPASDFFSAPELKRGCREEICKATDIYSVGAVAFYKIFGRTPGVFDRLVHAEYDFAGILFPDERYQPGLFTKLTSFFHHTLSSSPALRYQDMKETAESLADLEKMSGVEGMRLLDNFSYNFSKFAGRREELSQIKKVFEQTDVIFLSGMGGIGKTETARRFACEYREGFHRVVFLRFTGSIQETVCSEELRITECERDAKETAEDFYKRKMRYLKRVVSKEDLIILDNFDVEEEDDLGNLVNCGCKFLITTREDFSEYGFHQINIGILRNEGEREEIFKKYNLKEYSERENEFIGRLMGLVEYHTMTIVLLAKYLFHTNKMPSELFGQMLGKEGVAAAADRAVKHNKDEVCKKLGIDVHLSRLFDLTGFSDRESEMLRSLSLLGSVRIKRDFFLQFFELFDSREEILDNLIEHGWIEYYDNTDKISLHQIILDMVYRFLKPTAENCPVITRAMIAFWRTREESTVYSKSRQRLGDEFLGRLGGSGIVLAELYYEFCSNIKYSGSMLQRAEELCEAENSCESDLMRAGIYQLRLKKLSPKEELWDMDEETAEKEFCRIHEEMCRLTKEIFGSVERAVQRAGNLPYVSDSIVQLFLDTAIIAESIGNRICEDYFIMEVSSHSALAAMYREAEKLYLCVYQMVRREHISFELREEVYKRIIDFYSENDFMYSVRCNCVGDESKSAYYSDELNKLRSSLRTKDKEPVFNTDEVSYDAAAEQALQNKDYEKALSLYKKALEKGQGYGDSVAHGMSSAYVGLKQYEKAEQMLLKALEWDMLQEYDPYYTIRKLIELYELKKEEEKVIACCEEIIRYYRAQGKNGDEETAARVLAASIKKAKHEGGGEVKIDENDYPEWENCFRILDTSRELSRESADIYCEYAKYCWMINQPKKAFERIYAAANKYRLENGFELQEAEKIYGSLVSDRRFKEINRELYAECCVLWAEVSWDRWDREDCSKEILQKCKQAKEQLEGIGSDAADYLCARLKRLEADIYGESNCVCYDWEKSKEARRQCNYYLLTEYALKNGEITANAFGAWKDAADQYLLTDDFKMAQKCLACMEDELKKGDYLEGLAEYYSKCFELDCQMEDTKKLSEHMKSFYKEFIRETKGYSKTFDGLMQRRAAQDIGDAAFRSKSYYIGIYVYLICAFIELDEGWVNRKMIVDELPEEEKNLTALIKDVENAFPESLNGGELDYVVSAFERILEKIEGNEELDKDYSKIKKMKEKYQALRIEFKR